MLGSLTAIAAVVVADVARAEQQQRAAPFSDALPENDPAVVTKVVVKQAEPPRPLRMIPEVNMGRFEGY